MEKQRDDTGKIIPKEPIKYWRVILNVLVVLGMFIYIHIYELTLIQADTLIGKIKLFFILIFLFYSMSLAPMKRYNKDKPLKEYFINPELNLQIQLMIVITTIYIFGIM